MASSTDDSKIQRRQLADYLVAHRETILNRWRMTGAPDRACQKNSHLVGEKLVDLLSALLTVFTQGIAGEILESDVVERAYHHQIHRWQHGYPLTNLLTELDNFFDSLDTEIQHFLERYPQTNPGVIAQAYRQLRELSKTVNRGVVLPINLLRQLEAHEQVENLQAALDRLRQINSRRVDNLRQVTHDMRGYLGVISSAASLLQNVLMDDDQEKYLDMISRNVRAANQLLNHILKDVQVE